MCEMIKLDNEHLAALLRNGLSKWFKVTSNHWIERQMVYGIDKRFNVMLNDLIKTEVEVRRIS